MAKEAIGRAAVVPAGAVAAGAAPPSAPPVPAPSPPRRFARAAVASDHPLASAAGASVLKAGGNAIDAACATALALGVVHPEASGIGGGGFAMVYLAKQRKTYALDFRERAPAAATPSLFLKDGKADPDASRRGGLAVGVPGEVRGLSEMVRRFGALPFRRCVDPAHRLAARGFPVSSRLAKNLSALDPKAEKDRRFVEIFAAKARPEGVLWRRPDLARTLARLRAGPDVFYRGAIAKEIVQAVAAAGGVLGAEDLASYAVVERVPVETSYRGLKVASMPPPSSGGVALIETLGILSARYPDAAAALPAEARSSAAYLHVLAEGFKHAFADRARHLGDTDFVQVDLARLTAPAYHAELARRIRPSGVLPRDAYGTLEGPRAAPPRDGGTAHLSVIDGEGNAVALTTTVNLGFGAHLVAGRTGILLNNQMDDFAVEPGVPNAFGLIGNEQNAIVPGKRPLSSMTPTIAVDGEGRVRVVVGAAGGPTIITSTAQVLLNVVDWKLDAQSAIAAPRIHHQWFPEALAVEPGVPREVVIGLEKKGHETKTFPHIGTVNLLVRTDEGIEAAAEPRSPSGPAGY